MDKNAKLVQHEKERKKRLILAVVGVCVFIPLVIVSSFFFLDSSKYLVGSLLVLITAMLPFFLIFEKRRPKAREVVLIAVYSAIVILMQMFFRITLPIDAGSALIVISGVSLGPEAGFLIGALSRFILNFYMGQGPWTPWQMFSWGMLGFFAGVVFNKVVLSENNSLRIIESNEDENKSKKFSFVLGPVLGMFTGILVAYIVFLFKVGSEESFWGWRIYIYGAVGLFVGALIQRKRPSADRFTLTVFTIFTIFIFYGGIMNVCAMFTGSGMPGSGDISWDTLRVLFVAGFPYDLFHAATAGLFVFVFGRSIINKLERIKIKYGIYKS